MTVSQSMLSGLELATVLPERHGWPQTIGGLAFLDGTALRDPDGKLRNELANQILERLGASPALSRVIHWSGAWRGRAYWAPSADDLVRQVRTARVPPPGDEAGLLGVCADLAQRPLQLDRALWDVWLLDGLTDGRCGLMIRLHHVLVDGMAAVATLASLFDNAQTPPPLPDTSGIKPYRLDKWQGWHGSWRQLFRLLGDGLAPCTSLNRPVGTTRRLAVIREDMGAMKNAAHQQSVTINDILLSSITAGLRAVLAHRGEATDRPLRAMVPIAGATQPGRLLNATSGMLARLPVAEADPKQRLRMVATDTALRKERPVRFAESGILRSSFAVRLAMPIASRQRVSNIYVANIPGPATPLTLAGVRLLELFPLVSLMGNTTLGVAGLSYAGQFNISVIADRDSWPDLDIFVEATKTELNWLTHRSSTPGQARE